MTSRKELEEKIQGFKMIHPLLSPPIKLINLQNIRHLQKELENA